MRRIILALLVSITFVMPIFADGWTTTYGTVTQIVEAWGLTQFQSTASPGMYYKISTSMDAQSQKNVSSLLYLAKANGLKLIVCTSGAVTNGVQLITGIIVQ